MACKWVAALMLAGSMLMAAPGPVAGTEPDLDYAAQAADRRGGHAVPPGGGDVVTIVIVGDTGLNGVMQRVRAGGAMKHGDLLPWESVTRHIAGDISGDLNFANLETIVTARNDQRREDKAYNFRMHPAGARHLVATGFNLLSTANNHSMDFGAAGARDTLKHLEALEERGLLAYPGLGHDLEDASRPWPLQVKGARIMISALGIITRRFPNHRAGKSRVGQMVYQRRDDFNQVTGRLANAHAAYRILSVHYGIERTVRPDRSDVTRLRGLALKQSGIDLVIGHHHHVVQGVEMTDGKLIFYGLGNFLHQGTADMSGSGICRDYGLLAKLHLRKMPDGRLRARAIEAVPVTQMHRAVRRMRPERARKRIHVLNHLARGLDAAKAGAKGVRFDPRPDGTGLYCVEGARNDPGLIGALCAAWQPPPPPPASLARRIKASCSYQRPRLSSRSSRGKAKAARKSAAAKAKKKGLFSTIFGF